MNSPSFECPHCEVEFSTALGNLDLWNHIRDCHKENPEGSKFLFRPAEGGLARWMRFPDVMPHIESRKDIPLCTGVLDYFPDALKAIARVSKAGNDKHNPGEPLHWAREKSADHADCLLRHLTDRGKIDPETGQPHSAEMAWRALALLQLEEEERRKQNAT